MITWQPTSRAWATALATSESKTCTTLSVARIGTSRASGASPAMPSAAGPWPTTTLDVEVP